MKLKNIVFISYELYPINAGGCGVFLWNALQEFLPTNRYQVTLVLDVSKDELELFNKEHKKKLPNHELLKIVSLTELLANKKLELTLNEMQNIYLWKSYQFYQGLLELEKRQDIDYIEFFDYVGIGYYAVRAKKYEGKFDKTTLGVRAHCTIDLMDAEQVQNDRINFEKLLMYQMEKVALQMADVVVTPSESWKSLYMQRYQVEEEKIVISPPPLKVVDFPKIKQLSTKPNVLFYGRLFQLKGVDVYVDAAVQYLTLHPEKETIFYLAGYDGKTADGDLYENYLLERIPEKLRSQFVFTGQINRKELEKLLDQVQLAVFPNYVESFSYSIHELYYAGLPIICRPIPAFNDYFKHEENCMMFDGTVTDLTTKIDMLLNNQDLRTKLSYPYPVLKPESFLESYQELLVHSNNEGKIEESEKTKPNLLSAILLEEEKLTTEEIERFRKRLNSTVISEETSYVLRKKAINKSSTPVRFLGQTWYVEKLYGDTLQDSMLNLSKYVWIGKVSDRISNSYWDESIGILEKHDQLDYVASYMEEKNKLKDITYVKVYDLLDEMVYYELYHLSRAVMRVAKNRTLRDLFEPRLKNIGEWEILKKNGYVLPKKYQVIQTELRQIDLDALQFALHHETLEDEWQAEHIYSNTADFRLENTKTFGNVLNDLKQVQSQNLHLYATLDHYNNTLEEIYSSVGWKILNRLRSNAIINQVGKPLVKIIKKNKQVNNIDETADTQDNKVRMFSYIDDEIEALPEVDYLAIHHPDWLGVSNSTKDLFTYTIGVKEVFSKEEAIYIAKKILSKGIKTVIFSGLAEGYSTVMKELKRLDSSINILVYWHGNTTHMYEDYSWLRHNEILEMSKEGIVDKWGFAKESMTITYANLGVNTAFVMNYIPPSNDVIDKGNKPSGTNIGLYASGTTWNKNAFTQIAAVGLLKQDDVQVFATPLNKRMQLFAEQMDVNIKGSSQTISREELHTQMSRNTVNLYVTFSECAPLVPLESLSLGIPCITGPNHHYFTGTELENYLVVNSPDNSVLIAEKLERAILERDKIMDLYYKWVKNYNEKAKQSVIDFIRM